ncbi:sugar O-acetyltransferase [Rhodohalobacter barkolensis]|nr:sugar O-acetyltransferase [Rhodohalobacter barkolensis]
MSSTKDNISMREHMLAGKPYKAKDAELDRMHAKALKVMHTFNNSGPEERNKRMSLLNELFGALGANSEVNPPFYCDYGVHIYAGEKFFANYDCVILDCNEVRIGDRVLLGPKVQIYTATHPLHPAERREEWELAHPVTIEDDVWIGGGAIICPGVHIGAGTTIGAGSIVTRDIPANVLAAGNPCRVIRKLNTD